MGLKYILKIAGPCPAEVAMAMQRPSLDEAGDWRWVLEEDPKCDPIPFVSEFLSALEIRMAALRALGVSSSDITVWVLYEYDEQCNLEFGAGDMKRLGEAGITLCVSCWEG